MAEMLRHLAWIGGVAVAAAAGYGAALAWRGEAGTVVVAGPPVVEVCADAARLSRELKPKMTGEMSHVRLAANPKPAPNLTLRDPAGERKLADFRGRVILLNVWATWCPHCRSEAPALVALARNVQHPRFEVVSLNIDKRDPRELAGWLRENKLALTPNLDPDGRAHGVLRGQGFARGVPASILIDAEGCVVGHITGGANWASREAQDVFRTMLRGV